MFFVFKNGASPAIRERVLLRNFDNSAGSPCKLSKMRRLSTFFSLLFWGSITSFAQSSIQHFTVSDREAAQGFVTEKIWLQNFVKPTVTVLQSEYKTVINLPENVTAATTNDIEIMLGMERKRPFAFVRIPVFSSVSSGQFQQLSAFSLNIEENQKFQSPEMKTTSKKESVLASGNWYKISVKERGMCKIDADFIKSKLGVDPSGIDTRNIRVFGNGGTLMPEDNAVVMPDDLVENAIEIKDGGDNKLDAGDYILFYANGPQGWTTNTAKKTFYHTNNIYEDKSYYFITFDKGSGLRVATQPSTPSPTVNVTSYDEHQVYEKDITNIGRFGKKWWGEEFGVDIGRQPSRTFTFTTGSSDSAIFRISLGCKSASSSNQFTASLNGTQLSIFSIGSVGTTEDYAVRSAFQELKAPVTGGVASVQLDFNPGETNALGYLDYIEVISRRPLNFANGFTAFRDWNSVGGGKVAQFQIQNANNNVMVWDVTNPLVPIRMNGSYTGGTYKFSEDAGSLHEYIAFDGSAFTSPEFVKKVDNQNLHGTPATDFVIVTHPDFTDAANKLANFHRQNDNMRVAVVTTEQVYNEFGSGSQDIAAIRDFMKMLYKNAGSDTVDMPRYLLLLGDASYDYKNRVSANSNYVPTYETSESDYAINGYCSDDFYSFLDDHENIEGLMPNPPYAAIVNTMDLGVGRLPVNSLEAANLIVDKIIRYASPVSLGPWRLSTTIMADDGDGNVHFEDGEDMAATINVHSNLYNESKVYISALPTVSTPGGLRAPDANKTINDQVFKGTFLMNYNGHGSPTTLAAERILTQDDFNTWRNENKLPVMVTATCTFSKYDDPALPSAGELLIVKPDGGAIALLTTTQLVYQYLNHELNVNFLNAFFKKYDGKWPTFGDAFRISKNATYSLPNKDLPTLGNFRKFSLLGDPALTPAFPRHNVFTDNIVDKNTDQVADTIKALGKYQINGSVRDESGQVLTDFNGRVYVTIYDKPKVVNTLTGPLKAFKVQNNIIYKGKATVDNGNFSFTFIAPKDINYDMGKGKISYYVENGQTDGAGADTTLSVGGFSDVIITDNDGPVVKPFMNDSLFKDGGITGSSSVLYVQLFDESGINVSGNSIGHDLTAVLDDDVANPYILNDYYETAPNDYMRGYVSFPVTGLAEGKHTLRVKAWDMFNNSGEGLVNFEVVNGQVMAIQNLMNYPNPFTDKTHFVFEHNHPGDDLSVQINIYSTSGYLVRTLGQDFTPNGSRSNEIIWDGTDNNGAKLPTGLYVYRLNLSTSKGIHATAYQKLVLVR